MKKKIWIVLVLGFIVAAAQAKEKEPTGPKVTTSGYVDVYYSYNTAGVAPVYRVFDVSDNTFKTALVGYSVVVDGSRTAGRVDIVYGQTADLTAAGNLEHKYFQQAYATLKLGDAALDFGKFVTHLGYEVIPSKDNANLSRSLLFGYTIPFDHTGLRLSKPFGSKVKGMVCFVNSGWAAEYSANTNKSIGAQLALNPSDKVSVILNGIGGTEIPGDVVDKRCVGELIAILKPTAALSFGLDAVLGTQEIEGVDDAPGWSGAALYASYALPKDVTLSGRAEIFGNQDGALYSPAATLSEATFTLAKKVENVLLKVEFRSDMARDDDGDSLDIFIDKDGEAKNTQTTLALGFVYSF